MAVSTPTHGLCPADSQEPAAGICGQAITSPVTLAISADVPSPRCIQVTSSQALVLSNQTETALHVRLGGYEFDLLPRESANIDAPAGSYLAPGVHHVQIDGSGSAPEIWLVDQILGSDAPPEWGIASLPDLGFQISYPPQAELVRLESGVEIRLPVPPGTQMETRSLTIDVRPVAADTCYGGVTWDEVVTIDGVDFQASDPGEWQDAMGGLSFYRSDFAALHDGLCYRVALQMSLRDDSFATGRTPLPLPFPAEMDPQALYQILGTLAIY